MCVHRYAQRRYASGEAKKQARCQCGKCPACYNRACVNRWRERNGKLGRKAAVPPPPVIRPKHMSRDVSDDELDRKASVWLEQMGLR